MRFAARAVPLSFSVPLALAVLVLPAVAPPLAAQGVTTASVNGRVTDLDGNPVADAAVVALHVPTGTRYRAVARASGAYNLPNLRIGGPYTITASFIGMDPGTQENIVLNLGQAFRLDFALRRRAVEVEEVTVAGERAILNAGRTGAETNLGPVEVALTPSIDRSIRDLTKLDPRSDGNFSFAGRNWLYNNVSVDGSYFNNAFGLDDPLPGGQAKAQPISFEAIEQVQVSIAPFDVREGGFTGANVNTVTRSGTNDWRGSVYSFFRSDALQGNSVEGQEVVANPEQSYVQGGFSLGGPIIKDRLFFFLNGEVERTDDPGSNFVADRDGDLAFGESRVSAADMDAIRTVLLDNYGYDTGPYEGYTHETDNNKVLLKLDYNISEGNNLSFRFNYLDAVRDQGPHPFVLSANNSGRGPNESSLPFRNAGYAINNDIQSYAFEWNARSTGYANRFFASYNRFRDFREPFSAPFPTIEIAEGGVTYTTAGHEPFSIHNILDSDVLQFTNNFTLFRGDHAITLGANYERFGFFNSFNIFRHGLFQVPAAFGGTTFFSLDEFFASQDNDGGPEDVDLSSFIRDPSIPFKGENIDVGQLSFYAQDEFLVAPRLNLTYGIRVDLPQYYTDPVDNPFSRGQLALDENGNPETVDQSELPGTQVMWSPRVGFNWNAVGDRQTQVRGGSGIFTGRIPFVWFGNVISNPGDNPNLYDPADNPGGPQIPTEKGSILQQSFDLNAMDPDFKWPQVWTTDLAVDQQLPWDLIGTLEFIYSKDLNAIYMRNADIVPAVGTVPGADGRPYYGGAGNSELNPDPFGGFGAGIYVLDNVDEGSALNLSAQLRKTWRSGFSAMFGYSYTDAENNLQSTEIASVLWQSQPVQGNPNQPGLAPSQFGQRHRFIAAASYAKQWSPALRTQVGLYYERAEGNRFAGAGGNRYSFVYAGDVNGDGVGGNDLIYIPRDASEIVLVDSPQFGTAAEQWARLDAFIQQDDYLSQHRGQIAERNGALNPWYGNLDVRILQDVAVGSGSKRHAFQLSFDLLNFGNLIDSDWGVRKGASAAATSPLQMVTAPDPGTAAAPEFVFTGPDRTFEPSPDILSRWRAQIGVRYYFE
ncbi:MAG TPA: carboxypeptidase regulatory-like domain-containing protein [Gemmatimonadales bacterium]|nr:carboxypeptidase regulatory-like domain-containing protein [Gemmatimonadales bacterium]